MQGQIRILFALVSSISVIKAKKEAVCNLSSYFNEDEGLNGLDVVLRSDSEGRVLITLRVKKNIHCSHFSFTGYCSSGHFGVLTFQCFTLSGFV